MSNRYQIVVQGEASETDSDDEVYITSLPPPQTAAMGAKVVVLNVPLCFHHHKNNVSIFPVYLLFIFSVGAFRSQGRHLRQTVRVS